MQLELNEAGLEVLYDDRIESVGVKFKDADLMTNARELLNKLLTCLVPRVLQQNLDFITTAKVTG